MPADPAGMAGQPTGKRFPWPGAGPAARPPSHRPGVRGWPCLQAEDPWDWDGGTSAGHPHPEVKTVGLGFGVQWAASGVQPLAPQHGSGPGLGQPTPVLPASRAPVPGGEGANYHLLRRQGSGQPGLGPFGWKHPFQGSSPPLSCRFQNQQPDLTPQSPKGPSDRPCWVPGHTSVLPGPRH